MLLTFEEKEKEIKKHFSDEEIEKEFQLICDIIEKDEILFKFLKSLVEKENMIVIMFDMLFYLLQHHEDYSTFSKNPIEIYQFLLLRSFKEKEELKESYIQHFDSIYTNF